MAALALPYVESMIDGNYRRNYAKNRIKGEEPGEWDEEMLRQALLNVYQPLAIIKRLSYSACRMLAIQPLLFGKYPAKKLVRLKGFAHAMELFKVQCESEYLQCDAEFIAYWRDTIARIGGVNRQSESGSEEEEKADISETPFKRKRRRRPRRRKPVAEAVPEELKLGF